MRGRAWGTRGVENITSSNENLNAALQGGMPRDGLHNPRESVVVGVGMGHKASFHDQQLGYWQEKQRSGPTEAALSQTARSCAGHPKFKLEQF